MIIKIEPVLPSEFDEIFTSVKRGLFHHIDAAFGWDDQLQRHRLTTEYQSDWFYWIYAGEQRVGLLCFKSYDNALHVHFLIIEPSQQGKKIGTKVMKLIHEQAISDMKQQITLSSFAQNQRAIAFYQSLGYEIVDTDDHFVSLVWKVAS